MFIYERSIESGEPLVCILSQDSVRILAVSNSGYGYPQEVIEIRPFEKKMANTRLTTVFDENDTVVSGAKDRVTRFIYTKLTDAFFEMDYRGYQNPDYISDKDSNPSELADLLCSGNLESIQFALHIFEFYDTFTLSAVGVHGLGIISHRQNPITMLKLLDKGWLELRNGLCYPTVFFRDAVAEYIEWRYSILDISVGTQFSIRFPQKEA